MSSASPPLDDLLARAADGDADAAGRLLESHRDRLVRMVRLRIDRRLSRRLDASDVVQEVLIEADRRLPTYMEKPSLPFVVWLRYLAAQKIRELHRRHLGTEARDPRREDSADRPFADSRLVADRLSRSVTSPTAAARRDEAADHLHRVLEEMDSADREILIMRHFERLSNADVARELGIGSSAASKRYLRALSSLRTSLIVLGVVE